MSLLNEAQRAILHTNILAHPENDGLDDIQLAEYYNTPDPVTFQVWRTTTPVSEIQDNIAWSNFTPANPITSNDAIALANTHNQLLACQGKQFNLQMLLSGSVGFSSTSVVSTGKANIRAGLQDATSLVPSDVNLGTKTGGWTSIKTVIQRPATRLEKLFATGTGTSTNPGNLVVEGNISYSEISTAR